MVTGMDMDIVVSNSVVMIMTVVTVRVAGQGFSRGQAQILGQSEYEIWLSQSIPYIHPSA